jgi:hypothetical protein
VLGWGRVNKAWVYAQQQRYYLSETDEKFVRLTKGIAPVGKIFKRKDLVAKLEFDIEEVNESELKLRNQEKVGILESWLQLLMSDPNTPPTTLRTLKILISQKKLLDADETDMIFYSPDIDATLEEVEMLSYNIDVEFTDMNVDWFMKLFLYQNAQDTPAKERALRACHMAYQMSGQGNAQLTNQIDNTNVME